MQSNAFWTYSMKQSCISASVVAKSTILTSLYFAQLPSRDMVIIMCLLYSFAVFRWVGMSANITSLWRGHCTLQWSLNFNLILHDFNHAAYFTRLFLPCSRCSNLFVRLATISLVRNWFSSLFVSPIWQHLGWGVCNPDRENSVGFDLVVTVQCERNMYISRGILTLVV